VPHPRALRKPTFTPGKGRRGYSMKFGTGKLHPEVVNSYPLIY